MRAVFFRRGIGLTSFLQKKIFLEKRDFWENVRTDDRRDDRNVKSYKVYERCRSYDLSSKAFGLEDVGKALEYSLKTVHAIQVGVSVEKFISQKVSLSHWKNVDFIFLPFSLDQATVTFSTVIFTKDFGQKYKFWIFFPNIISWYIFVAIFWIKWM